MDNERIVLRMPDPSRAARWSDDLIDGDTRATLQNRLDAGGPIAVRVPITVRPKGSDDLSSWFDIHLMRDRTSDGRPTFVREGIIVSDVRGRRAREIRSLVLIEHKPLATMLGDSENPSHTQWQKDGSNFKGRYTYGGAVISFVAESVGELVAILNRRSEEADPTLTVDYFSVEPPADETEDTEEAATRRPKPGPGPQTPGDKIEVEPRLTRVRIASEEGGFSVLPGSAPPQAPYLIEVRCAYDIRTGNPLKKWDPADFRLGSPEVPVLCEGASRLLQLKGNWALLRIDGSDFHVRFQGFDLNRDVYVRVELREAGDADQAA